MSIPYFTRQAGPVDYGGGANKRDYGVPGPVNPQTDVTAEQLRRLAADAAAMARMAPMCVLHVQLNDTAPDDPTVTWCQMPFGSASYEGDDPPAGFPLVERTGSRAFRVTLPSPMSDAAGNEAAPVIRFPMASAIGTGIEGGAFSANVANFAATDADDAQVTVVLT